MESEVTYNYKDTALPMTRIQDILKERYAKGESYSDLALKCSTTAITMSHWIKNDPNLKWYSLMDICIGLEIELLDIFRGTRWESLL